MDHDAGMPPKAAKRLQTFFTGGGHEQVVTVAHEAARRGRAAELPEGLPAALREALIAAGVHSLYGHQAAARDAAGSRRERRREHRDGERQEPLLPARRARDLRRRSAGSRPLPLPHQGSRPGPGAQAHGFRTPGVVPAIYDGDTPQDQRPLLRRTATIVLSNPDMLHVGILPGHERWAEFLHQLRYVVLDEAHVYRGVFGSHVAQVVRRLRRICARTARIRAFVLTSATIASPNAFAERLVGAPFKVVDEDQAPRPERTVVLWNPPLEDPAAGARRSALAEASYITAESLLGGARVIAFAPTRKAAELDLRPRPPPP